MQLPRRPTVRPSGGGLVWIAVLLSHLVHQLRKRALSRARVCVRWEEEGRNDARVSFPPKDTEGGEGGREGEAPNSLTTEAPSSRL